MFIHILKRHSTHVLRALFITLSLLSTASQGQGERNGAPLPTPSTNVSVINRPSVEQTLVPESVLAMQLAEALELGPISDEAKAEELLSGLGIEPKNGWIAEYPVTPEVLGGIEKGIVMASEQGKIALTKDQALQIFGDVKARLGFDVKPGPNPPAGLIKKPGNTTIYSYTDDKGETHFTDDLDSIPKANRKNMKIISQAALNKALGSISSGTDKAYGPQYMANPESDIIDKQYDEQGPPLVTYYAPPDSYNYLYSWVAYPFWSTGLYYPGYFVLKDFHRHVYVNRHPYYVSHHHHGCGSDYSRSLTPGPVKRGLQGQLRPDGMNHSHGFSTPKAQAGARAIVGDNPYRKGLTYGTADSRRDTSRKSFSSAGNSGTFGNSPVVPGGRIKIQNDIYRPNPYSGEKFLQQPSINQRNYVPNTPRFNSPPAISQERDLRSTPRSFGGNGSGGFQSGGVVRGFQGGGNFTGRSGGGASAGAASGGHR